LRVKLIRKQGRIVAPISPPADDEASEPLTSSALAPLIAMLLDQRG
jgi:hypothetical protein